MAASFWTLRVNRLGGGLPSGAGGVSSLTSTLNCRSRSARLRGASGSAVTRRLAVASELPFQASAGMPPVRAVRKPVGLASKLTACECVGATAPANTRGAATATLAREAIIGDGDLEMAHRRAGLDHGKRDEASDHRAHDDHGNERPQLHRGHAESVSGTEQRHGAGNLPGPRGS